MASVSFLWVGLAFLLSCASPPFALAGTSKLVPMAKYQFDLDMAPDKRWLPILEDFKSSAPLVVQYFESMVPTKAEQVVLEKIMASFDTHLGELGVEMKSIADYWGIDLGIIVGLNFAYELRRIGGGHPNTTNGTAPNPSQNRYVPSACTSIVAQDGNGNVVHGRNLDWSIPNYLRNLTVQVDFIKGGKAIATGVVTTAFVGVLTGISPAGFSMSINERELGGHPTVDYLEAVLEHAASPSHLLRKVLLSADSYQSAVGSMSKEKITAPTYFIMAGDKPGDGVVLTRDRNSLSDSWTLNPSQSWYILETNYDHWKPTYEYDNRRYYGNEYMKAIGQTNGATTTGLKSVLTTSPVQNEHTSITVLMCPKTQSIESYNVFAKE